MTNITMTQAATFAGKLEDDIRAGKYGPVTEIECTWKLSTGRVFPVKRVFEITALPEAV